MSNYQPNQPGRGTPQALPRLTSNTRNFDYVNPFQGLYPERIQQQFQMNRLTNNRVQRNIENQLFRGNNNINLTPTSRETEEKNTADILELINAPVWENRSEGKLTLVVFLWQHGSVCNFAENITPTRVTDKLKMKSTNIYRLEDGGEVEATEVEVVSGPIGFPLENLWVANLASPGAVLSSRGASPIEDFIENIEGSPNSKAKIANLSHKLSKTHPISKLYKLVDKGQQGDTDCFDFSVAIGQDEGDKMGLTKILGGELDEETNNIKNYFLQQPELHRSGQVPRNYRSDNTVMFSEIIKQTVSEVAAANYGLLRKDGHTKFTEVGTLGITNILFINATCQAMNDTRISPPIAIDSMGDFNGRLQRSVNPLYIMKGGGRKTRSRRKKRKDIRKRKKKTNKSRRKTRRKKRKKRKQRKKNTRKKWELRGGKCTDARGQIFRDYLKRDYDRCMKNNNQNNKISKTYCCAAAIKSRADFINREREREINRDVERWAEEEKGYLRNQRIRKQRRITNFHRQQSEEEAQTKRSMRLWNKSEGKEKKKFYDSFEKKRVELLNKQKKRFMNQQGTHWRHGGYQAQIEIIVKQTKEFINQMNDYVATKLGGWSQGIQQQKIKWKTEQQQLIPIQEQQVKQQGIDLNDPQSYANGLNQELEFLFNQLTVGIDEDILKEYVFVKALEEDIKNIKKDLQASGQNYIPVVPGKTPVQQSINLRKMAGWDRTQNLNMAFKKYPPSEEDNFDAFVAFNSIYPRNNNQSMQGGKRKKKTKRRRKKKSRC